MAQAYPPYKNQLNTSVKPHTTMVKKLAIGIKPCQRIFAERFCDQL